MRDVSVRVVQHDLMLCRVRISGEVDLASMGSLRCGLEHVLDLLGPGERVVVDASGVTFLSAGGVRVLADVADELRAGGGDLVVEAVSPVVERVLRVCGQADLTGVPKG
jgi:anti-anti-sigma factor